MEAIPLYYHQVVPDITRGRSIYLYLQLAIWMLSFHQVHVLLCEFDVLIIISYYGQSTFLKIVSSSDSQYIDSSLLVRHQQHPPIIAQITLEPRHQPPMRHPQGHHVPSLSSLCFLLHQKHQMRHQTLNLPQLLTILCFSMRGMMFLEHQQQQSQNGCHCQHTYEEHSGDFFALNNAVLIPPVAISLH